MGSKKELPLELFVDMFITLDKLSDHFNCNDGQLEEYELDWWYFHKIVRRAKYVIENIEDYGN